jgi:hypothetical protein
MGSVAIIRRRLDVVFDGPIFVVGNDGLGCHPSFNLVLINQAHELMSFIHYSGLERYDNSLGVIDHSDDREGRGQPLMR